MKKKKYIELKKNINLINAHIDKDIILIGHLNNLSVLESLKIQNFCFEKKISNISVRNNVLKKLFLNKIITNILVGPTKIYFFSNILDITNFIKTLNNKLIPLIIFWNKTFYDVNIFIKFVNKNIKNINNNYIKQELMIILKINIINIINIIKNISNQFILNLNKFKKN